MGTVNLLEASRTALSDKNVLILIVSSDKCYLNDEAERAFKVGDPLGGNDPYSASKAGTEVVYHAYINSSLNTNFYFPKKSESWKCNRWWRLVGE